LTHDGIRESWLVADIYKYGVVARPSADEVIAMKHAGVSDRVVEAMLNAEVRGSSHHSAR
jgi:hypothetical protein